MYDPEEHEFLSVDPIAYASGQTNLYEYVSDNPISYTDTTGLAAWKHENWWDESWKAKYRDFVHFNAKNYLARTEDCADLAMTILIDFASENGLPITLRLDDGRLLVSKSCEWSTKDDFLSTAKARIGARALFDQNTGPDLISTSVQPGDIMISTEHAALVVNVMHPGELSDGQTYFGNVVIVKPGVRQWDKAAAEAAPQDLYWIYGYVSTDGIRVDYLNHTGSKNRQFAEMKYNRRVDDLMKDGFKFRFWNDIVFSNYKTWDGKAKLSAEY